ncbi:MAG: hypothetical protein LBL41_03755 [Bifidobacteriaceae bacterium]|jgi:hypothetical protein|nr:hypothetical protein [Bifidobacteriaceae bacterium]
MIKIFRLRISNFSFYVILALIFDLTVPFLIGRQLSLAHGKSILQFFPEQPAFYAFFGWLGVYLMAVFLMTGYARRNIKCLIPLTFILFFFIQILSGFCFIRPNFHNVDFVVFGEDAYKANALNAGMVIAFIMFFVYAIYFFLVLFATRPDSQYAKLVSLKYSLIGFTVLQVLAFLFLISSGLLAVFYATPDTAVLN